MRTILCTKWGTKYDGYEIKLYEKVKDWCDKFYCITDNPVNDFDIKLPDRWTYKDRQFFTHQKLYQFNEDLVGIEGDKFLAFDLDLLIHNSIEPLWDLTTPHIIRSRWHRLFDTHKNWGRNMSTTINSSLIRWDRGQCLPIYNDVEKYKEYTFFTYFGVDNYLTRRFHKLNDDKCFFDFFPEGIAYSWYKGNVHPHDMETHVFREDQMICLFNNSCSEDQENMDDVKELRGLW